MSLTVSSFFWSKMKSTNPSSMIVRFMVNTADTSDRVTKYRTISRDVSKIIGGNYTVEVENASQLFNILTTQKTWFYSEGKIKIGYMTATGSEDTVQLFGGELQKANFAEEKVSLTYRDRMLKLSKLKVGTNEVPVSYTNTSVNPADLAWWIVTSYGGLSTIKSTSNPDISYSHWYDWWYIFDDNSTVVKAEFDGDDIPTILEIIAEITDSAIYAEGDNKLYFSRWTGAGSEALTITDSIIAGKVNMTIDATHIVNTAKVLIDYNVTSGAWGGAITKQNTASINSYGTFEKIYDNENVWLVNSSSAVNLAERVVYRRKEPNISVKIPTPLTYLNAQLGDEVELTTQIYSFNRKVLSLLSYQINIEKGTMVLNTDEGFGRGIGRGGLIGFKLDDAYWGLLDESYNPLT